MKAISSCFVIISGLLLITNIAHADASASLLCVSQSSDHKNGKEELVCDRYELNVSMKTSQKEGEATAFGIIAYSEAGDISYWTQEGGWAAIDSTDLIQPVDDFQKSFKKPVTQKDVTLYRGTRDGICALSNHKSFSIYAWHATLAQDQIKQIHAFLERFGIEGNHARNFWDVSLIKNEKGSWIFTQECNKG